MECIPVSPEHSVRILLFHSDFALEFDTRNSFCPKCGLCRARPGILNGCEKSQRRPTAKDLLPKSSGGSVVTFSGKMRTKFTMPSLKILDLSPSMWFQRT